MHSQTRKTLRRFLANRTAVVAAGTAGFLIGAGGFVAAQQGADDSAPASTTAVTTDDTIVETTTDNTVDSTVATTDVTPTSIDLSIPTPADDGTSNSLPGNDDTPSTSTDDASTTSVDDSLPGSDDATSNSLPGSDDATSSSLPGSDDTPSTSIDDNNTSTTIDDATSSTIDDDDHTSTSIPVALPGPFTETYQSSGGSITVSWSGSAFSIDTISPAAGFAAEIEDNSWDKVRVDFENGDNESRIEVRLNDGQLRVRID